HDAGKIRLHGVAYRDVHGFPRLRLMPYRRSGKSVQPALRDRTANPTRPGCRGRSKAPRDDTPAVVRSPQDAIHEGPTVHRFLLLLSLALPAAALAQGWEPYVNARFGFTVEIPPGFALVQEAGNGDG